MKLIFLSLAFSVIASAGLQAKAEGVGLCNLPVQNILGRVTYYSVPMGTCDEIGVVGEMNAISCKRHAEANGYSCFQMTAFHYLLIGQQSTICFTCVK